MAAHPAEDLDRSAHRTDRAERPRSRAGRGGSPRRQRAGGSARQEQRADEMAAAAVVLLRRRLACLVGADRDVLGAVIRGEVAAPERDHGRRQRGKCGDGFLREKTELRATGDARRRGAGDDRHRDPRPLERETCLGEGAAHVGEHRERLGEPQRAADERRRHVRCKPALDAGGRADRAVGCADSGAPRGWTVHEDPVRESHAAEPQLVHAVRVPCCDGLPSGARPHRGRAAGRRAHPRRHRRTRRGGEDDARPDGSRSPDRLDGRVLGRRRVRSRSARAGGRRAARPRRSSNVRLL